MRKHPGGGVDDSANAVVTLAEQDSGRTIDVALGQRVVVRLGGDRTTGYSWVLIAPDAGALTTLGVAAYAHAGDGLPDAGGIEAWSFRASRRGEERLRFEYRRPWMHDAPPTQVVRYTINVC